jgi:D-sedoheptulose 7-phosphate isomerase
MIIFSRFIEGLGQQHDVLLGISTSSNSANNIKAAGAARNKDMKVITLTGKDGGQLASLNDIEIQVSQLG